ncbi:MAG TPA: hypothetical protein EYN79_11260 [Planctomycetes bacterium]|nr:hypothetical protein [Planctomycetota bacterium]HIN80389.1 hypothetical protein [Planctomycetota bacterium]
MSALSVTSIGPALGPTVLCALLGAALHLVLSQKSGVVDRPFLRPIFLCTIFLAFTTSCALLVEREVALPVVGACTILILLSFLPALVQLLGDQEVRAPLLKSMGLRHRSPWGWRWRCRMVLGSEEACRGRLEKKTLALTARPIDAMLRLEVMELCLFLGELELALYHAHVLDEMLPTGDAHAHCLWRQAHILAERQLLLAEAQPVLNRLVTTYPEDSRSNHARRLIELFQSSSSDGTGNPG